MFQTYYNPDINQNIKIIYFIENNLANITGVSGKDTASNMTLIVNNFFDYLSTFCYYAVSYPGTRSSNLVDFLANDFLKNYQKQSRIFYDNIEIVDTDSFNSLLNTKINENDEIYCGQQKPYQLEKYFSFSISYCDQPPLNPKDWYLNSKTSKEGWFIF